MFEMSTLFDLQMFMANMSENFYLKTEKAKEGIKKILKKSSPYTPSEVKKQKEENPLTDCFN